MSGKSITPTVADRAAAEQPTDAQLDLEFAFTDWGLSCKDPSPTLRQCRRGAGHDGLHASGFGSGRLRWAD